MNNCLPDITSNAQSCNPTTLRWVGMEGISIPIDISNVSCNDTLPQQIFANANIFVSLDSSTAKGIHMSRLYQLLKEVGHTEFCQPNISKLLDKTISSQDNLSQSAKIELKFDIVTEKPALISSGTGFQRYPFLIRAIKSKYGINTEFEFVITYSSTCPCSASLSRKLFSDQIEDNFEGENLNKSMFIEWLNSQSTTIATPHSQRSFAYIRLDFGNSSWPDLRQLILQFEKIIGTPVQTAVKRVDEIEFARMNANNLIFCEDIARRLKTYISTIQNVSNYWLKIEHQESLHQHNAVVVDFNDSAFDNNHLNRISYP